MFNGIVQGVGIIEKIILENKKLISIKTNLNLNDCKIGSSILCDGICLTIVKIKKNKKYFIFSVNISEETNNKSNLKYWKLNSKINLEKSLKLNQEISGHFVYGHIDCTSKLIKINNLKNSWEMFFSYPSLKNKKYISKKGSIAINGISLTIANLFKNNFSVSIISHTFYNTNLSTLKINDNVNLEFDMLARYVFNRK